MFLSCYVKGVPFFNGSYTKGVPFLSKMVYKRVKAVRNKHEISLRPDFNNVRNKFLHNWNCYSLF